MRILNYVMAALFLFGALVQLNDPDPAPWLVVYLAAAAVTFLANKRPIHFVAPAVVGAVAIAWAASLASAANVPVFGLFEEWEMQNEAVEVTREYYGLGIIGFWMIVLTIRAFRRRRAVQPEPVGSI